MNGTEVNTDEIEQAFLELESDEIQEEQTAEQQEKKEHLKDFPIQDYVYQLEKMGAKFLTGIHEKLEISDADLKTNSEMLSVVIEKNFSADTIKNSPEILWAGHTLLVGGGLYMVYMELKAQGELNSNNQS